MSADVAVVDAKKPLENQKVENLETNENQDPSVASTDAEKKKKKKNKNKNKSAANEAEADVKVLADNLEKAKIGNY